MEAKAILVNVPTSYPAQEPSVITHKVQSKQYLRPRQSEQEGDERGLQIPPHPSKRRREDSQQSKTFIIRNSRSLLHISIDDIVPRVTDLVQRLVREELNKRQLFLSATINQTGSRAKFYELVFKNDDMPPAIYTFSKIKAKDDMLVEIALYDIRSQTIVTDGPLSSTKIEICVLNGEFSDENWTADEFKAKILSPRNNKGQLLKGDTVITLKNGVGYIDKIVFTDNSSWMRRRRFRLGAKVVQSTFNEPNIKEGRSKPFMVKDNRGQANEKHYPPSLNDEIWRLTKIRKDGEIHKQLCLHEIHTVKDLLQLHETNPSSLQEIFGKNKTKLREAIIKHAKTCVADPSQNALNSDMLVDGYRNVQDLITPVDNLSSLLASLQSAGQCGAQDLQALQLPTAQQDQLEKRQDFSQPGTSTSYIGGAAHNTEVGFQGLKLGMCMEENIALSPIVSHVPTQMPDVYSMGNDFAEIPFANDFSFSFTGMGSRI